jgi:hypothetical protein
MKKARRKHAWVRYQAGKHGTVRTSIARGWIKFGSFILFAGMAVVVACTV